MRRDRIYQVLALASGNAVQVEHQKFETVLVLLWQSIERFAQMIAAFCLIHHAYAVLAATRVI